MSGTFVIDKMPVLGACRRLILNGSAGGKEWVMDLGTLRINQLTPEGWKWYQEYLTVLDAYDVDGYADLLSPNVSVQFNNDEPMIGREVVKIGLGQFWGSVTAMGYTLVHAPLNVYGDDQHFVLEALNHYDKKDGTRITVRATAWTDRATTGRSPRCACTKTSHRCMRPRRADTATAERRAHRRGVRPRWARTNPAGCRGRPGGRVRGTRRLR